MKLFAHLSDIQQNKVIHCLHGQTKEYRPGDFLFLAGESAPKLGLLLFGQAHVVKENVLGESQLIDRLNAGSLFGETFAAMEFDTVPVSVVAKEACRALFLDMNRLIDQTTPCLEKQQVLANLMQIIAYKNERLRKKMSYLTHKTIRSRLDAYFLDQVALGKSQNFFIPYNRTELAEYLCMDRSAMSRELSKMKQEGKVNYHGKEFYYALEERK